MRNQVTCAPALHHASSSAFHASLLTSVLEQSIKCTPRLQQHEPCAPILHYSLPHHHACDPLPHRIRPQHLTGHTWEGWQALCSVTSGRPCCTTSSRLGTFGWLITLFTSLGMTQSITITTHSWRIDVPWNHPWGPSVKLAGAPRGIWTCLLSQHWNSKEPWERIHGMSVTSPLPYEIPLIFWHLSDLYSIASLCLII